MYRCLAAKFGAVLSNYESLHILRPISRFVLRSELPPIIHRTALRIRLKHRKDEAYSCYIHVFGLCIYFQHGETKLSLDKETILIDFDIDVSHFVTVLCSLRFYSKNHIRTTATH